MAVQRGVAQSFITGVSSILSLPAALGRGFGRASSLIAWIFLLVLATFSSPAHALTCPDATGGNSTTPIDVTYYLTETGCFALDPGVDVKTSARVIDEFALVSFLRPRQAHPTVSTSFTTGAGCDSGGSASTNSASYARGVSTTCQVTIRLTNGTEFSFATTNDSDGYATSLTDVRLSVAPTTTTLASSPNPSTFGDSVTLTAVVSGGAGAAMGNVDFKNDATSLGVGALADAGGSLSVVSIASGPSSSHACAVTTEGGVKCWGQNEDGQLGDGSTADHATPADVSGLTSGVVAVAVGGSHTCALTSGGQVKCWGRNTYGQLGDATTSLSTTPVDVGLGAAAVAIAAGTQHSCALTNAGNVKCWGLNDAGQLGTGDFGDLVITTPTPQSVVDMGAPVASIAAGAGRSCAVTTAGAAKCWGDNQFGGLGDNSQTNRASPTDVSGLSSGVASISVGENHTCAVMTDGDAKCWGRNFQGQIGDGTSFNLRLVPVDVVSGTSAISAGSVHTCAVTTAGGVHCWGDNQFGQLGDGSGQFSNVPIAVADLTSGVKSISAGTFSTFAVTTGMNALAWGLNSFGRLGDGTTNSAAVPVDVSGLTGGKATATLVTSLLSVGNHSITATNGGDSDRTGSTSATLIQTVNKAASTVVVTASPVSPSALGQSVTFTATVSSAGGVPGGTVSFSDDVSGPLGVGTLNPGGGATLSTSALSFGDHTITATYSGNGNILTSTGTRSHAIGKAVSTTVLTASPASPSTFGQSVTLTATVTSAGGAPSGSVSFNDGATVLGTATLNGSGVATFSTSALSGGSHTITATYSGAALFLGSVSTGRAYTVNKMATSTTLAASPASQTTFGQSVTFSATVVSGAGTPSGSVTFKDGATVLGTATLDAGGLASLSTAALNGGAHSLTATYSGAANFLGSASAGLAYTVNKAATTTTLSSLTPSPGTVGQTVTLSVVVGSPGNLPTGTVSFSDSIDGSLGAVQIDSSGAARFTTGALSAGAHTISATMLASANFNSSTGTLAFTVGKAPSKARVTAGPLSPSAFGQPVTFTVNVEGGAGAPTGQVTLKDGVATLTTATLTAASARTAITSLAADNSLGNVNLNHVCAVTTMGGVTCWGNNKSGQLGDGTLIDRPVPVDVPALATGVTALAVGSDHSCALTSAGGVKCWGDGTRGQLGNGGISRTTPVDVTGLTSGVVAIAAGGTHSCALTVAGGVKCWGTSSVGAVGDGTLLQRNTPVGVTGLASGVSAISAGPTNVCVIMAASGGAKCWGLNSTSQIGDGTTTNRTTPANVIGLTSGVAAIANGPFHTCAVTTAGVAKCWGENTSGQVGDGTTGNIRATPVSVASLAPGVRAFALGSFHSCALTTAGAVKCWGNNFKGPLGDGTTMDRPLPVDVVGLGSGVKAIAASKIATFAATNSGIALSWGDGFLSALGTALGFNRSTPGNIEGLLAGRSTASFTTSALSVAAHSLTAVYAGDANRTGITSPALTHIVAKAATIITFPAIANTVIGAAPPVPAATASSKLAIAYSSTTTTVCTATSAGVLTLVKVGTCSITASQAGNANFLAATPVSRTFSVIKGANTITFPALANIAFNASPPVPAATASSGLPVSYSSTTTAVCTTTTAGVIKLLSAGTCTIAASQAGNANFLAATTVSRSFIRAKGPNTITFPALANAALGSTPPVPKAVASSSLAVTYSSTTTAVCTVTSAGAITMRLMGTCTITASQAGNVSFVAAVPVARSFSVTKRISATVIAASKNPVPLGTAVVLSATVGSGATGNVTFRNGATTIATVPLTNGAASTAFTPSLAGTLPITAAYAGNANLTASTSATLKLIAFASCKDGFAAALPVTTANASVFGSTVGANGERGEPNHAGNSGALNSVWCTWTAPAAGTVTIDTTGSSFDTTLGVYTGTAVGALTQVAANDNIGPGNTRSRVRFAVTAGKAYRIAIDGVSATGSYLLNIALAPAATPVTLASVLPSARSIARGTTATAFATMINTGAVPATACSLSAPPGFPANFSYQTTNAANVPIGTPDTPVNIAAGKSQGFLFTVTPLVDLNSSELAIVFDCTNTPTTITVPGVNTLILSASSTPSPDLLISIVTTPSGTGIINIPGNTSSMAFGTATVNIGAAGTIIASIDDNGRDLAFTATLCVTSPKTGVCTNPATPTATFPLAANGSATIAVFVTGKGTVPFDPGANRIFLRFKTADGVTRGATSVVVRTQ